MERKPYSAGAVKFSFWFMEFRKTVQLLSEGKSFADIKKLNEETNIYEWFLKNAERYDNIRILKSKMENAIFEKLTDHFIIMTGSMAEGTQDRV